jgi:hypothetical protein
MAGLLGVPGLDGYRAAMQDNQSRDMNTVGLMQGVLGLQSGLLDQQMQPLKIEQLKMQLERQRANQQMIQRIMGGGQAQGVMPSATDALTQGAAQGDVGPTVSNAARMEQPQMSQGQPQGNGLELPPMIQAALLSGDPGLEKWAQAQAQQFKPTDKIREAISLGMQPGTPQFKAYVGTVYNQGGAWQANAQGGVGLVPGYAEGQGAVKGAEAAASAPYQIQEFEIGGRKYRMSVADYKAITEPPKNDAEAMRALQMSERMGIPYDSGWIRKNGQQTQAPEMQAQQPTRAGFPSLNSLFGSSTESEKAYDSERSKDLAKEAQKFNEAYQAGNQQRDNLDLLDGLLRNPKVSSGALAEMNSDMKGVAASFGINIAGKTEEDVIRAITREMALKMKNSGGTNLMPGAMSDFEQKMLGSMVPSLSQSAPGRMLLSQVMRAKLNRDMKIAEMAADYEATNGRLDSNFYKQSREWLKANPTFPPEKQRAMMELAKRIGK